MAKDEYIHMRVSPTIKNKLSDIAFENGMTVTSLVITSLVAQYPEIKKALQAERKK